MHCVVDVSGLVAELQWVCAGQGPATIGGVGAEIATPVGIQHPSPPHTPYAKQSAPWIHLASNAISMVSIIHLPNAYARHCSTRCFDVVVVNW